MFSTFKQRLLLGIYILILLSIPVGAYLASQSQTTKSQASEKKIAKPLAPVTPKPASPAKQLLDTAQAQIESNPASSPTPSSESTSPTIATSFGPTLSLKVALEGRPQNNQTTKLFIGIADGALTTNPKFVLSFTVDLPASGEYSNLSLAGLSPGSRYTALVKGSAQIAASLGFTMSPTTTNLNDGEPVNLLSGDLNDDNTINSADQAIMQKALGSGSASSNWNENADLNKDKVINVFDMSILTKNLGQTGASGAWTSPIPKIASGSAALNSPQGSPEQGGYWIWIPK